MRLRGSCSEAIAAVFVLLTACAPPRPIVVVPPKEVDGLSATLAGVKRTASFESSFDGDFSEVMALAQNNELSACKIVKANGAAYMGLALAYVRFASKETLDECVQTLIGKTDPNMRAIIKTAMFMLQAAGFAWFSKADFAAGLHESRLLFAYRKSGLTDVDRSVIDEWHEALGVKAQRRAIDLSAVTSPP